MDCLYARGRLWDDPGGSQRLPGEEKITESGMLSLPPVVEYPVIMAAGQHGDLPDQRSLMGWSFMVVNGKGNHPD
jgi:hypothetical protein